MAARRSTPWMATVAGLAAGAVGIGLLWASGMIDFPFYPPPGMLILTAGTLFVALAPWRWVPVVGVVLGVFMIVGFLASGGIANLMGALGPFVSVGLAVQMIGIVVALVAGVVATVRAYRSAAVRA
jgi:hypothetical protein